MRRISGRAGKLLPRLSGGDLRSIGRAAGIVRTVRTRRQFDELLGAMALPDRLVAMRAADAVEKITAKRPALLRGHTRLILRLVRDAEHKELKWHLALLVPRLDLTRAELGRVWATLCRWALDMKESRIVRVNSIQALFELSVKSPGLQREFDLTLGLLDREEIPSIRARIRILRKKMKKSVY